MSSLRRSINLEKRNRVTTESELLDKVKESEAVRLRSFHHLTSLLRQKIFTNFAAMLSFERERARSDFSKRVRGSRSETVAVPGEHHLRVWSVAPNSEVML